MLLIRLIKKNRERTQLNKARNERVEIYVKSKDKNHSRDTVKQSYTK